MRAIYILAAVLSAGVMIGLAVSERLEPAPELRLAPVHYNPFPDERDL